MRWVFRRYTSFRYVCNLLNFLKIPFGRLTGLQITCFNGAESSWLWNSSENTTRRYKNPPVRFGSVRCSVQRTLPLLLPTMVRGTLAKEFQMLQRTFRHDGKKNLATQEYLRTLWWVRSLTIPAFLQRSVLLNRLSICHAWLLCSDCQPFLRPQLATPTEQSPVSTLRATATNRTG